MMIRNALFTSLALVTTALAQDPPSRVARLSLLNGPVSFQPASVEEWTAASLNYPLTTGDHLYTDARAAAEIRMGPHAIRLASQTNFGFLNLDDQTVQMRFTEGSISIRLRGLTDQDVWEVDTPNGAVSLIRDGDYRIDTDPNRNATMVTVRGGEAEVSANGQTFPVRPRQTAYFTGDGRQESIQAANPPDDFDRFTQDRDRQDDAYSAPRYVSQNMVGYEDLDRYGDWEPSGEDGPVWHPRVQAGWAPYHDGRWAWREPWGWTWVDDAPWGFAPFHYGRWAFARGRWGWCPGAQVIARPVYAPALVAFVGWGGSSISIGPGVGGIGWFPLGPREAYTPAYRVSPRYTRDLNIGHVRNLTVTNVYINRGVPGAFSAVSRQDFVTSRQVQRSSFAVRQDQFRSLPVSGFSAGVAPQRESFGRMDGNVARPQRAVFDRAVIGRTAPPPAPVAFAARQDALRQNGGRPLAPEQIESLRARQGAFRQPVVRSAISPNEGFGRNAGTLPRENRPVENRPVENRSAEDRGFGRPPQPDTQPRETPVNRGFGREAQPPQAPAPTVVPENPARNQRRDRFESRPPQTIPSAEIPAENRGFGRGAERGPVTQQPAPQPVPQSSAQPVAPPQPVTPRVDRPAENRGFGRGARPEQPPVQAPAENRGFGRAAQREQASPQPAAPESPRAERPAENRGFGRGAQRDEAAPRREQPAPERQKEQRQKQERPKEDKP